MMVCVVPGVVLAAAYMLRMLQKVAYGGTRNPDHSGLKDLGFREIVTLAPLLVFVFWIGLHPGTVHPRHGQDCAESSGTSPATLCRRQRTSDFALRTSHFGYGTLHGA